MPRQVRTSAERGSSRQACSSFCMYPDNSTGETPWGARQGTAGNQDGDGDTEACALVVTSASDICGPSPGVRVDGLVLLEHELGVAERAHFGNVETFEFHFRGDP